MSLFYPVEVLASACKVQLLSAREGPRFKKVRRVAFKRFIPHDILPDLKRDWPVKRIDALFFLCSVSNEIPPRPTSLPSVGIGDMLVLFTRFFHVAAFPSTSYVVRT